MGLVKGVTLTAMRIYSLCWLWKDVCVRIASKTVSATCEGLLLWAYILVSHLFGSDILFCQRW